MVRANLPAAPTAVQHPVNGPRAPARGGMSDRLRAFWVESDSMAPVLGMFAYFLMLGSIAVVVLTGQFPWFIVAPATVLAIVAHCRRLEARWARQATTPRRRRGVLQP